MSLLTKKNNTSLCDIEIELTNEINFLDKYNSSTEIILSKIRDQQDVDEILPVLSNRQRLYKIIEKIDLKIQSLNQEVILKDQQERIKIQNLHQIRQKRLNQAYTGNEHIIQVLNNSFQMLDEQVCQFLKNKTKMASYYKNGAYL